MCVSLTEAIVETEDYSDWESVDEEDADAQEAAKPAPKGKGKAKAGAPAEKSKTKTTKVSDKSEGDVADGEASSRAPSRAGSVMSSKTSGEERKAPAPKKKAAPTKKVPAPSTNVKGKQQTIANFFGAKAGKK